MDYLFEFHLIYNTESDVVAPLELESVIAFKDLLLKVLKCILFGWFCQLMWLALIEHFSILFLLIIFYQISFVQSRLLFKHNNIPQALILYKVIECHCNHNSAALIGILHLLKIPKRHALFLSFALSTTVVRHSAYNLSIGAIIIFRELHRCTADEGASQRSLVLALTLQACTDGYHANCRLI